MNSTLAALQARLLRSGTALVWMPLKPKCIEPRLALCQKRPFSFKMALHIDPSAELRIFRPISGHVAIAKPFPEAFQLGEHDLPSGVVGIPNEPERIEALLSLC